MKDQEMYIQACAGFCNDIEGLLNDIFLLDSIARSRLVPVSPYPFEDDYLFRKCNSLMTNIALQVRLWISVIRKLHSIKTKEFQKIGRYKVSKQRYDIFELQKLFGIEIQSLEFSDYIHTIAYLLNVGKVKTTRKKLFVNLDDTCNFIAHAERSWFKPVTNSCISSTILIHLEKRKNYKTHTVNKYDGRIYEICLSRFALTSAYLIQSCYTCAGEYGTIEIDNHEYPKWPTQP